MKIMTAFKINRLILALLLAFSLTLALPVVAQTDDDAPRLELVLLESGASVSGEFSDEVNAHLYAFYGSAGDTVIIRMTQGPDSPLDPYLVLLGPAGEVFAADDDSGEVPLAAEISDVSLPADGTYFILATTLRGLREGPAEEDLDGMTDSLEYNLLLLGATTPESLEDAEEFEYFAGNISIGESASLTITPEEPVFYVQFVAEAGDTISIITEEIDEFVDTLLYLFDSDGNRIAVNDDIDFAGGNYYAAIEDFTIPADGLYLVFATSFDFNRATSDGWANDGTFRFSIE